MDKIKTRPEQEPIRTLDQFAGFRHFEPDRAFHIRDIRDDTENGHETAEEYAENRITENTEEVLESAKDQLGHSTLPHPGNSPADRPGFNDLHGSGPTAHLSTRIQSVRREAYPSRIHVRSADRTVSSLKTIQSTAKGTAGGLKTAEATGKAAIRTGGTGVKTTGKAAQATAQSVPKAVTAVKNAAAGAYKATVAVGKAVYTAIRSIAEGVHEVAAAVIAGGWVSVVIIVVVCLIGLIAASSMGLFFSDDLNEKPMRTVIREINTDYQKCMDTIKSSNTYDELILSGSSANWKEVLAVYSVMTDTPEAQETVSLDEYKRQLLEDTFWAMNQIGSWIEVKSEEQVVRTETEEGGIQEETVTIKHTILHIDVSHKSADEMADLYLMDEVQREQIHELLGDEYEPFWKELLYGVQSGIPGIVVVAMTQVGNAGGEQYWTWYGYTGHVDWCCIFVSWCADQCGMLESRAVPRFASTGIGVGFYKDKDMWVSGNTVPEPGWLVFFDWDDKEHGQNGLAEHVGIVEKVEGNMVYTIEGNVSDECRRCHYPVGWYEIFGYGITDSQ